MGARRQILAVPSYLRRTVAREAREYEDGCCYEAAAHACGEQMHREWDYGDEDLFDECNMYTMVHAKCPGTGLLFDFNPVTAKVEVMDNLAEIFSPDWPQPCENGTRKTGCWNQRETPERARLMHALSNRSGHRRRHCACMNLLHSGSTNT